MAQFIKLTFRKSGPLEKADPGTLKSGLYAKIHCIGKKHIYSKLEVADFKYDDSFSQKLQNQPRARLNQPIKINLKP